MRKTKKRRMNGGVKEARNRVLAYARRKGTITNEKAKEVGGWLQSWYHLHKLCQLGLLKRGGFNDWRPTRSRSSL